MVDYRVSGMARWDGESFVGGGTCVAVEGHAVRVRGAGVRERLDRARVRAGQLADVLALGVRVLVVPPCSAKSKQKETGFGRDGWWAVSRRAGAGPSPSRGRVLAVVTVDLVRIPPALRGSLAGDEAQHQRAGGGGAHAESHGWPLREEWWRGRERSGWWCKGSSWTTGTTPQGYSIEVVERAPLLKVRFHSLVLPRPHVDLSGSVQKARA